MFMFCLFIMYNCLWTHFSYGRSAFRFLHIIIIFYCKLYLGWYIITIFNNYSVLMRKKRQPKYFNNISDFHKMDFRCFCSKSYIKHLIVVSLTCLNIVHLWRNLKVKSIKFYKSVPTFKTYNMFVLTWSDYYFELSRVSYYIIII